MTETAIKKEITKEGVRFIHPSGVIQILTPQRLNDLKALLEEKKAGVERNLADLQKDIDAVAEK